MSELFLSVAFQPTLGVSASNNAVLYVILGPVGPYFASGFKPVSLLADPSFIRAWRGGCGFAKMGANYAPTVMVQVGSVMVQVGSVMVQVGSVMVHVGSVMVHPGGFRYVRLGSIT